MNCFTDVKQNVSVAGIYIAKSLKECTVCHEIKKSACRKSSCCIVGIKPKMITTATQQHQPEEK